MMTEQEQELIKRLIKAIDRRVGVFHKGEVDAWFDEVYKMNQEKVDIEKVIAEVKEEKNDEPIL